MRGGCTQYGTARCGECKLDGDVGVHVLRCGMRAAIAVVLSGLVMVGLVERNHGSLVVAMPVASGWVVCGDKRKMSNLVDPTEDEVKVFALGPGVVAAATGLRRVIEGETLFDVVERVQAFARTRPFDMRARAPSRAAFTSSSEGGRCGALVPLGSCAAGSDCGTPAVCAVVSSFVAGVSREGGLARTNR